MNILVTGGAGFIGSNFVKHYLQEHPADSIVVLDKLTYAGNLANLDAVSENPRYKFVQEDICNRTALTQLILVHRIDAILNFAAETHVDRSIMGSAAFIQTNVVGTQVLLDLANEHKIGRFVQVSTDEVYGSLGTEGKFFEETPLHPNSPYSASKAAADLLCQSYHHTFGTPVAITRCSNNYGPNQFPEKLIPLMIINALHDKPLPVYGDGRNVRDWLHVLDHCRAIDRVLHDGKAGEVYNIGGSNEWHNIDIVKRVLGILGKPESLITYVKDRPGHDRRYAIDSSKIKSLLKWEPAVHFEDGIKETVEWYVSNRSWWESILTGEYREYYKRQYEHR